MNGLEFLKEYIVLLVPIIIIELALLAVALIDLIRRPQEEVTGGNKLIWGIFVVLVQILGPLAYLVFGRKKE